MKFYKNTILTLACTAILSLPSCKKYLEKVPDNRAEINTVQKLAQLLTTAYPDRDYMLFAEAISDNSEDKGVGIGNLDEVVDLPYAFRDVVGAETGSSTAYWNACYGAIATANQALASIEENNFGADALPYKGEALVCRAYAHFMLAAFFAKPYAINGDNSSPGIPYVTQPETKVIQNYSRGTVQSTYDAIRKDLEEGLPLLKASAYSVPKYHFTPEAAHAFASRLYLFTGEWQKVIDHANLTVSGNDFAGNMRPISTTLKSATFEEHRTNFMSSEQKYNLLLISAFSYYARYSGGGLLPRHGYGVNNVNMFNPTGNVTGKQLANQVIYLGGVPNYTTYKYKENFFYTTPDIGFAYMTFAALTVDEALANRAEAYAELGNTNAALADLNTFYSVRIQGYNPTNDAITPAKLANFYTQDKMDAYYGTGTTNDLKAQVITAILDAKKSQFLQEGLRWLDVVRKRIIIRHNNLDASGLETFSTLSPDDPRRVFQLPVEVTLSGVEQNPR